MKKSKGTKKRAKVMTIGRDRFGIISAVEGLKLSRRANEDFADFDRRALTPAERRREILRKYAQKQ